MQLFPVGVAPGREQVRQLRQLVDSMPPLTERESRMACEVIALFSSTSAKSVVQDCCKCSSCENSNQCNKNYQWQYWNGGRGRLRLWICARWKGNILQT